MRSTRNQISPKAPTEATSIADDEAAQGNYRLLPMDSLRPGLNQPRHTFDEEELDDLCQTIRVHGVLQPIIVRPSGNHFEIVAGERRWRAARAAGLAQMPVMVRDLSDEHSQLVGVIENIQRQDIDPLEEAQAYHHLIMQHGFSHLELAYVMGKSRAAITNSVRLLKMPQAVLQMVTERKLTAGHVRPLIALKNPKRMVHLAKEIYLRKLSVREVEEKLNMEKMWGPPGQSKRVIRAKRLASGQDGAAFVENLLEQVFGTDVRLRFTRNSGRIVIKFNSLKGLKRIAGILMKEDGGAALMPPTKAI